ncbi:hypothetical protein ACEPAF_1577 [Sanghuangporus sanghuang]
MTPTKLPSYSGKDASVPNQILEVEETKDTYQDSSSIHSTKDDLVISPEERRLIAKLDRRILPIVCLMYLFSYLDRSNVGNARLQGLADDALHGDPTGVLYDWVFSAFFFSYVLCQVPAVVASKLFPPHLWLGTAAVGWGVCSTLMSTGFNFAGLFVARVGLGLFEACFGPGIPLYLSYYYTRHELGLRLAYYQSFAAVAGAFSGLVAFGIQNAHAAIANWRLLFIIEGIPTVLAGITAILLLPQRPEMTRFLSEEERKIAIERMNRAISGDVGFKINKTHVGAAFKDWRVYVGGVVYFGVNCGFASISGFLPTIIKSFGFTNATAQLLTVPPYAVAGIILIISSYASDRVQNRGFFIAAANMVSGIGNVILLAVQTNQHARYFAVFCITSGTFVSIGLLIAWYAHNLGSETKRATGMPLFMAIGLLSDLELWPVSCALEFTSTFAAIILSASYILENRRRDRAFGKPTPEDKVDTSELADKAPMFRYVP